MSAPPLTDEQRAALAAARQLYDGFSIPHGNEPSVLHDSSEDEEEDEEGDAGQDLFGDDPQAWDEAAHAKLLRSLEENEVSYTAPSVLEGDDVDDGERLSEEHIAALRLARGATLDRRYGAGHAGVGRAGPSARGGTSAAAAAAAAAAATTTAAAASFSGGRHSSSAARALAEAEALARESRTPTGDESTLFGGTTPYHRDDEPPQLRHVEALVFELSDVQHQLENSMAELVPLRVDLASTRAALDEEAHEKETWKRKFLDLLARDADRMHEIDELVAATELQLRRAQNEVAEHRATLAAADARRERDAELVARLGEELEALRRSALVMLKEHREGDELSRHDAAASRSNASAREASALVELQRARAEAAASARDAERARLARDAAEERAQRLAEALLARDPAVDVAAIAPVRVASIVADSHSSGVAQAPAHVDAHTPTSSPRGVSVGTVTSPRLMAAFGEAPHADFGHLDATALPIPQTHSDADTAALTESANELIARREIAEARAAELEWRLEEIASERDALAAKLAAETSDWQRRYVASEEEFRTRLAALQARSSSVAAADEARDAALVQVATMERRLELARRKELAMRADIELAEQRQDALRDELRAAKEALRRETAEVQGVLLETQRELTEVQGAHGRHDELVEQAKQLLADLQPWLGLEIVTASEHEQLVAARAAAQEANSSAAARAAASRASAVAIASGGGESGSASIAALAARVGHAVVAADRAARSEAYVSRVEGVLVTAVRPNGPALLAGFKRGDLIEALNGSLVTNNVELREALSSVCAGDRLDFQVRRAGNVVKHIAVDVASKLVRMVSVHKLRRIASGVVRQTDEAFLKTIPRAPAGGGGGAAAGSSSGASGAGASNSAIGSAIRRARSRSPSKAVAPSAVGGDAEEAATARRARSRSPSKAVAAPSVEGDTASEASAASRSRSRGRAVVR